jgi:type IV pilus assembly protein PilN
MIRINLLQEKKTKRVAKGERTLLAGAGIVLSAAAGVYLLLHVPKANAVEELRQENAARQRRIQQLTQETREFDTVQAQLSAARAQEEAIGRLNNARAVPSWMLAELSNILTRDHKPTMSPSMAERIKNDANRQFTPHWDPKRIWITTLDEKDGVMTLTGGAQSTTDVTQFALRMQASVFFTDVQPVSVQAAVEPKSKLSFYNFTLTGKVLY